MYIVNRYKHSSVEKKSEDLLIVRNSLSDSHHEMVVELEVSIGLFKILKVKAEIIRAPFELCFQLKDMQKIVGLNIQPGIFKEAKKLMGGPEGCAHLLDLVMEGVKAVIQSGFRLEGRQMSTEEKQKMYSDFFGMELKETCHVYDKLLKR